MKLFSCFKTGLLRRRSRSMAVFTQVLNPILNQNEWAAKDDTYDYHQEVANAGFGDMLHDWERNKKYFQALRKTIARLHSMGREAHVLDIGTGTGILSMMAVASGADSVTACEAFLPMANCAEKILESNGMKDKIRLIKKRSTDIQIGEDMQRKANLLVSEVLDTELIGEGAIGIYNHAHAHLLTDDVICIPSKAICYVQVVSSPLAAQWNSLKILANLDGDVLLKPPSEIAECKGEANLHDVQLSQLPLETFRPVTQPIEIFQFDFNAKERRESERQRNIETKTCSAGSTDLVFYWWEISMDLEGDIRLSCAPFWAHPDLKMAASKYPAKPLPNVIPWRDHWMQAIYYVPKPLNLQNNDTFTLQCCHDEYSLWFDVTAGSNGLNKKMPRHECSCRMHLTYSRSRIGQLNESVRNKRYMKLLEEQINGSSNVLVLGDSCLLGLSCIKLGAKSVICYEPQQYSREFLKSVINCNQLENVKVAEKLDSISDTEFDGINYIFGEPYFLTSILPWDNFYFGTLLMKIKEKLRKFDEIPVSPHGAKIYCVPLEFLDLHKIRSPVKECEGFDLRLFDDMVQKSTSVAQAKVEAQPLWEYPGKALAKEQVILQIDFKNFNKLQSLKGTFPIELTSGCNGIALWVDWLLDINPKSIVSSGPIQPIEVGSYVKWNMFVRQGVQLMSETLQVESGKSAVHWEVNFNPNQGLLDFNFMVK
ncbi:arginine methyltransferase 7 [Musca autumnalis]|uniref:arginine methyltransferase 7 n=1 Tax=Musca autumnalis TaxID=221902 RepID=UPI003CFAD840